MTEGLYYHKNENAPIYTKEKGKGRGNKGLTKEQIKKNDGNYLIGPSNPEDVDKKYDYPDSLKKIIKVEVFKNAIKNIYDTDEGYPYLDEYNLTIFVAALIAESSRAKFTAVEHLKEIYRRDKDDQAVGKGGKLPMARGGSDAGQEKFTSKLSPDKDLEFPENEKRKMQITDAVFNNLADDDLLFGELSEKFLGGLENGIEEKLILKEIIDEIKIYLNLIRD